MEEGNNNNNNIQQFNIYYTPHHSQHNPQTHYEYGMKHRHPEEPRRLEAILTHLQLNVLPHIPHHHLIACIRQAEDDELQLVHSLDLIHFITQVWVDFTSQFTKKKRSDDNNEDENEIMIGGMEFLPTCWYPVCRNVNTTYPSDIIANGGRYCYDTCTPIGQFTFPAAKQAAAAAIDAALHFNFESQFSVTYVLVRPPGHHATRGYYGGFCYFNNAALAANILRQRYKEMIATKYRSSNNNGDNSNDDNENATPIAIFDIDYHHGNGTQDIFYNDSEILYISLHASPEFEYPHFAGGEDEKGEGKGEGFNYNFPFPRNATFSDHYLPAIQKSLNIIQEKKCKILVVSLGLDAAKGDPVGTFSLLPDDYRTIANLLLSLQLPIFIVQEGGYSTDDTLASCVASFITPLVHRK